MRMIPISFPCNLKMTYGRLNVFPSGKVHLFSIRVVMGGASSTNNRAWSKPAIFCAVVYRLSSAQFLACFRRNTRVSFPFSSATLSVEIMLVLNRVRSWLEMKRGRPRMMDSASPRKAVSSPSNNVRTGPETFLLTGRRILPILFGKKPRFILDQKMPVLGADQKNLLTHSF